MDLPNYIPDNSLLNDWESTIAVVTRPPFKERGKYYLAIKHNIPLFSLFYPIGYKGVRYYFPNFTRHLPDGSKLYELKRADGYSITNMDVNRLNLGRRLKITGTFQSQFIKDYQKI